MLGLKGHYSHLEHKLGQCLGEAKPPRTWRGPWLFPSCPFHMPCLNPAASCVCHPAVCVPPCCTPCQAAHLVHAGAAAPLQVLRPVVPQEAHHQFSWRGQRKRSRLSWQPCLPKTGWPPAQRFVQPQLLAQSCRPWPPVSPDQGQALGSLECCPMWGDGQEGTDG